MVNFTLKQTLGYPLSGGTALFRGSAAPGGMHDLLIQVTRVQRERVTALAGGIAVAATADVDVPNTRSASCVEQRT